MVQLKYDGTSFYTEDPYSKERNNIPLDQLSEEFDPGACVFFDYGDGIIFSKSVNRDQFVAGCQRVYQKTRCIS